MREAMYRNGELMRFGRGVLWGIAAAAVMAVAIGLTAAAGASPFGGPFPTVIAQRILGFEGRTVAGLAGTIGHLAYGGLAGGVFAWLCRPMTLPKGVGYGLFLWFTMQITFVPALGWLDFGLARSLWVPVTTLVAHAIYGLVLGELGALDEAHGWQHAAQQLRHPVHALRARRRHTSH